MLEDTGTTEQEQAVKTERKTRSKRAKENLDEVSISIFKNKKRNNYVSYPADDEPLRDTTTKQVAETQPSRTLRKNALKEHNTIENNDQLETQAEAKNLTRKSRRHKGVDDAEESENLENVPAEVKQVPKSKKGKKKNKVEAIIDNAPTEDAPPLEEAPAKKSKKKKKKKGQKISSIIVEDVLENDGNKNPALNRSTMSVDSFHSAAGSPLKNGNINTKQVHNTFEKIEEINKPFETNRNNKKISNNKTFDNNVVSLNISMDKGEVNKNNYKRTKKRKSVAEETTIDQCFVSVTRDNLEKGLEDILNVSNLSTGQEKRRKSNTKDATFEKSYVLTNLEKDVESNLNDSKVSTGQSKRRKSNVNNLNELSHHSQLENMSEEINNGTFDKELRRRSSVVKNVTIDKNDASIAKEINDMDDSNTSNKHNKTRRSMVKDSTFDKSNTSVAKEIAEINDVSNISKILHKTRNSIVKDSTFDKSNTSIANEMIENDTSTISYIHHKTRRSIIKDSTFEKSNTSIAKEVSAVEIDLNVSKKSKARKSVLKDSTFAKSNTSIIKENNIEKDEEPNKQLRRKSNIKDSTFDKQETLLNTTFEKETEKNKQTVKDSTFNKSKDTHLNATYEKDQKLTSTSKPKEKKSRNTTYDKTDKAGDTMFEKDNSTSFDAFKKGAMTRKSSIRDASFDKGNFSIASITKEDFEKDNNIISSSATKRKSVRLTFDKNDTISENFVNTTYEKPENTDNELKRKSSRLSKTQDVQTVLNTTFEKDNTNEENENLISSSNSKNSLISSDNSSVMDKDDISRISITSDETSAENIENIVNTTPLLIESSIDESHISITKPGSPKAQTPLIREGTFTKDAPEQSDSKVETPTKRKSVPTAGCTPYHVSKSSQKKTLLNVTRSLEKGVRASVDPAPRLTRVMFCSPVDNPVTFTQEKRKIIKSNLKGSNKSFVFDENGEFHIFI